MKNGIRYYEEGEQVNQYLFIKSVSKGVAVNGKPFLTLILQDKSGEIEAKLWDVNEEVEAQYREQTIVHVSGTILNYRGKLQLRIKKISPTPPGEKIRMEDLIEMAPMDVQEMKERITSCIFEMENPKIQRITRYLLKKYENDFFQYPAATKNHHEFMGGLAYHVVSMLELAGAILKVYPTLNRDLLYAGIILHDLGKVIELSGPASARYTAEGTLLGHISIMVEEIGKAAEKLDIFGEEVMVLKHIVLSHHGKEEWGSPKPPMVREAEVLHFIDNLDAKMCMIDRALARTKPGEFSERIFALDNRSFYKPIFSSTEPCHE